MTTRRHPDELAAIAGPQPPQPLLLRVMFVALLATAVLACFLLFLLRQQLLVMESIDGLAYQIRMIARSAPTSPHTTMRTTEADWLKRIDSIVPPLRTEFAAMTDPLTNPAVALGSATDAARTTLRLKGSVDNQSTSDLIALLHGADAVVTARVAVARAAIKTTGEQLLATLFLMLLAAAAVAWQFRRQRKQTSLVHQQSLSLKQTMRELRLENEKNRWEIERLETVEPLLYDGIWEWALADAQLKLNDRCKEITGWESDGANSSREEWLGRMHRDDCDRVVEAIQRVIVDPEGQVGDVSYRVITREGLFRWVETRFAILRDERGRPRRVIGTHLDTTEQRELRRIRDNFISIVSHELRTPLSSIIGSLDLVHGGVMGELPAQAEEMLKLARNNSDRLLRLINQMLDVEQLEAGGMRFNLVISQARPLLDQSVAALIGYARTRDVLIEVEDNAPDAKVEVDPDRLIQALVNLISNAVKFSPPGGVIKASISRVETTTIRIAITDQGPGIPEDFRARVFDRFTQADTTATREKEGTGIGLTIARSIVKRLDGRLDFFLPEGGGTTFYIDLKEPWA